MSCMYERIQEKEIMSDLTDYQMQSRATAIYPAAYKVVYPALGLAGETGEVLDKIKKRIRDANANFIDKEFLESIEKELGDVLWYIANLATDLDLDLHEIALKNLLKLARRQEEGKLSGSGDNR